MAKRSYSETDIQEALAVVRANNGNVLRAYRELGGRFPRSTIQSWSKGKRRVAEAEKAEVGGVNLGDARQVERYDEIITLYQAHAAKPEVVAKANAVQAMTAVGIAADKRRALLGKPESHREVEHRVTYSEPGTFRRYIDGLKYAQERGLPPPAYTINVPALLAGDDDTDDGESDAAERTDTDGS